MIIRNTIFKSCAYFIYIFWIYPHHLSYAAEQTSEEESQTKLSGSCHHSVSPLKLAPNNSKNISRSKPKHKSNNKNRSKNNLPIKEHKTTTSLLTNNSSTITTPMLLNPNWQLTLDEPNQLDPDVISVDLARIAPSHRRSHFCRTQTVKKTNRMQLVAVVQDLYTDDSREAGDDVEPSSY